MRHAILEEFVSGRIGWNIIRLHWNYADSMENIT